MSYARFGKPAGSQVYVYDDVQGGITCCGCTLVDGGRGCFNAKTSAEMVVHLREHQDKGWRVPESVVESVAGGPPGLC